jgi:hypothetical protein
MYDIRMLSSTLTMADRFQSVMSYDKFINMFQEEQREAIEDILVDFGYLEMYWPPVIANLWMGRQEYRWS